MTFSFYLAPISWRGWFCVWPGNHSYWHHGFVIRFLWLGFVLRWGYKHPIGYNRDPDLAGPEISPWNNGEVQVEWNLPLGDGTMVNYRLNEDKTKWIAHVNGEDWIENGNHYVKRDSLPPERRPLERMADAPGDHSSSGRVRPGPVCASAAVLPDSETDDLTAGRWPD